ncbi:MAG: quinoprotein glucose dehydrogenase [Saprospiraceae bacterium]
MKLKNIVLLFVSLSLLNSCQEDKKQNTLKIVNNGAFGEEQQITPILADGLAIKLWAPGPLLSNAVALTINNQGVAFVAETSRRKSSDIDIRQHPDWKYEDLGLKTMEDTRDFHMAKMATSLSDENTWLDDFNKDSIRDYRDLSVQSEYIRRIWDGDGDGRADRSELYADGFNGMLTGIAAGILSYDDEIYLTAAPDLWKLKDTNNDGHADQRESLSYGYGIHIAYAGHDMSGLTIGPDGKIYWSIGDMGVNTVDQEGRRYAYPHEGAVMRANPDGSDLEVFAHGLRNPQDLAFDAYGNLISVDNDGDHPGEHERYVHILEGSDSGWRIHWQYGKYNLPNEQYKIWMDEMLSVPHFDGQAAYLLPPVALAYNGPAGLAYNPGTALNEDWNGYFFASFFTASSASSKIQAFRLSPKGASFAIDSIQDILGGIVPTGITFGPDGGLYLNDWKDSYDKKPEGRIWKIDSDEARKHPLAKRTQEILIEGAKDLDNTELEEHLSYPDQRVRLAAQFELVKRKEEDILKKLAIKGTSQMQRIHAIWGLGQLGRKQASILNDILPLLSDKDIEIQAQVAKVIGDAKYKDAYADVLPLLESPNPRVQLLATEAIRKLENKGATSILIDMLASIKESDPHLRHAVIYALSKLASPEDLQVLSDNSSKHVRIGAVVALRMLRSSAVSSFLNDSDELVVTEAARAINDDVSIPGAIQDLAASLTTTNYTSEAYIRRAINANLRMASKESAIRLAEYSKHTKAPLNMRLDALWALGYWGKTLELDRVDGSYRALSGHKLSDAHDALSVLIPIIKNSKSNELRAGVVSAMGRLNYDAIADNLYDLYWDPTESSEVKFTIIETLKAVSYPRLNEIINDGLTHNDPKIRGLILENISALKISENDKAELYKKIITNNPVPEKQKAIVSLRQLESVKAASTLTDLMQKLINGEIAPALQLDIYDAAKNSDNSELKKLATEYDNILYSKSISEQYAMSIEGGDAVKGRRIFIRNNSAQCLRCHAAGGYGGEIGPDLTKIASLLSKEQLMESLVEPNARLAPGYGTVYVTMKDGKEVSGILIEESENQITLKTGDKTNVLLRSTIAEIEQLPSGMLNMVDLLSRNQLRDLMAFLVTLK